MSNIVGFGRQLVFAHTVGTTCLGTAYATANQVPNIVYDVVLGGVLTTALVPVLAGPAARRVGAAPDPGAATETSQIASALLTWTVLLLAPVSLLIALAAGPLATVLLAGAPRCAHAAMVAVSTQMLVVFAPQILLYGLAVVLYGILQAHRRFTAPALAPVLSSLVVIAAYLAFVPLSHGYQHLWRAAAACGADAVGGHHGRRGRAERDRARPGAAAAAAAAARAALPARGRPAGTAAWPRSAWPRSSPRTRRWWW